VREKRSHAAAVLDSPELLMMYALGAGDVSVPCTPVPAKLPRLA
jgi:hypothetical protein